MTAADFINMFSKNNANTQNPQLIPLQQQNIPFQQNMIPQQNFNQQMYYQNQEFITPMNNSHPNINMNNGYKMYNYNMNNVTPMNNSNPNKI